AGLIALFTVAQFIQIARPSVTTFLVPIELFPTRVRGTGHGLVPASGKLGVVLTGLAFGNAEEAWGSRES
ncbi:hypothetical protein GQ53DRAFT_630941, partial [Thozetella sp. PMI_491]